MTTSTNETKDSLRKQILNKRKSFSQEQLQEKNSKIFEKLFSLQEFSQVNNIGVYVSFNNEVETRKIIEKLLELKKNLFAPVMDFGNEHFSYAKISSLENLTENKYGVLEPKEKEFVEASQIDVFLVPGAAFDSQRNRIGWGKGYYDKFFNKNNPSGKKIGLFFEFQLIKEVPVESFDVKMDFIITEKEIYRI